MIRSRGLCIETIEVVKPRISLKWNFNILSIGVSVFPLTRIRALHIRNPRVAKRKVLRSGVSTFRWFGVSKW
jgi:hypothetical protein